MTDEKFLASLAHPARRAALACIALAPASADDIAKATCRSLGVVAYHVRALHDAGLITVARTERVRGAVKTTYELAPTNGLADELHDVALAIDGLADLLRTSGGVNA